jgi:hypothetical protein
LQDFARDNICLELLITEQEVKDQLEILNNFKPSGPDGVTPRILRSVSQCLVSPLHYYLISHVFTIISNLDIGKDIRFIFCDISKAFNRVWHTGLLYKLRKIGIDGNLLSWVTDYRLHS